MHLGSPRSGLGMRQFVELEEKWVSSDKGSRVVHYSLKEKDGGSMLTVVGTERSLRHMVYAVSDEFLSCLPLHSSPAFLKWRSRREVLDWMSSFLYTPLPLQTQSQQQLQSQQQRDNLLTKSPTNDSSPVSDAEAVPNRVCLDGAEAISRYEDRFLDQCVAGDVVWVGTPWSCKKKLQHYGSFQRNGITIPVHSFVYVLSEGKERHVAYIEDMYEDKKAKKKLRVRWFHKSEELSGPLPHPPPHPREVFITPFSQVLSVECVDGVATVLTPLHYEHSLTALPLVEVHMCSRQFDNEGVKPFNLSLVEGYSLQRHLALIDDLRYSPPLMGSDSVNDSTEIDEDDETLIKARVKRGRRTARCSRKRIGGVLDRVQGVVTTTGLPNMAITSKPRQIRVIGPSIAGKSSSSCSNPIGSSKAEKTNNTLALTHDHHHSTGRFEIGDKVGKISTNSSPIGSSKAEKLNNTLTLGQDHHYHSGGRFEIGDKVRKTGTNSSSSIGGSKAEGTNNTPTLGSRDHRHRSGSGFEIGDKVGKISTNSANNSLTLSQDDCYRSGGGFEIGDKVELLCQDSGVRGCWFRCTVLKKVSERIKVCYDDLETEDGTGRLEEWVWSAMSAAPDVLGMRVVGRLAMRPTPVNVGSIDYYEVGSAVDAWWNDGWWEGIILSKEANAIHVYFPDEKETASFLETNLRTSRDWYNGKWLNVRRKSLDLVNGSSIPSPRYGSIQREGREGIEATRPCGGHASPYSLSPLEETSQFEAPPKQDIGVSAPILVDSKGKQHKSSKKRQHTDANNNNALIGSMEESQTDAWCCRRDSEDLPPSDSPEGGGVELSHHEQEEEHKLKKSRPGHENLKPLLNSPLFINSMPLSSLVMSR